MEWELFKIAYTLINTFFLSLSGYLFAEVKKYTFLKTYLLQILVGLFWIAFYYYFSNNFGPHITSISIWILGIFFVAPFLAISSNNTKNNIKDDNNKQEKYTGYFWTIVFILGVIIKETLYYLFDLNDIIWRFYDFYQYWYIICFSLLSPIFALTKIPQDTTNLNYTPNKFFSFLLKYIFVPAIFIYFVILYTYSIKVLINFGDWPRGQITWIVIAFASFGYFFYILSNAYEQDNTSIKIFRKYFPIAVIPQLFMLFYAIYLRVEQHDITINRYLVIAFGLWLLGISLYFIFSKKKYTLVVPLSIGIISLVISIWPRGFYSVAETRQLARLENNLKKANILQANWTIIPLKKQTDIDEQLSKDIGSWIRYLCDFNNCKSIKTLFAKELVEQRKEREKEKQSEIEAQKKEIEQAKLDKDTDVEWEKERFEDMKHELKKWPDNWDIRRYLEDYLKVKYYRYDYQERQKERINIYNHANIFPLEIKWYSIVHKVENSNYTKNRKITELWWYKKWVGKESVEIPFDMKAELIKRKDEEKIYFDFVQGKKKYKFIVESANFTKSSDDEWDIEWYLLIGNK